MRNLVSAALCLCLMPSFLGLADVRQKPRALLLQQASSAQHELTLFALKEAGFDATQINKERIADAPKSADEFRKRFDVVFFGGFGREGGIAKLLSKEQIEGLKEFVRQGGGLVAVIAESGSVLGDILPVTTGPAAGPMVFRPAVTMPDHPALTGLPTDWPTFGSKWNSFNKIEAKPGAQVLMEVPARYADKSYPFLIAWQCGKGRVICLNSLWTFTTGKDFERWEWSPAVFGQWGRWAAGMDPVPRDKVAPIADRLWFWQYERDTIPGAAEHVNNPVLTPIAPPGPEVHEVRLGEKRRMVVHTITEPPRIEESDAMLVVAFGNGMIARIDKRGMVGYRTKDGLVLAKDPVDDTPHILHSGAAEAKMTNADGGEFAVLEEALPQPGAGKQTLRYLRHAVVEQGVDVTFQLLVNDQPEGDLLWRFRPRTMMVDGVEWRGVGESFVLTSPRLFVEHITPRHRWALGGQVEGCFTFRTGCYSQPRGYGETHFTDAKSQDAGHFRWFSSGQPFQMMGSPVGALWCYADTPAGIASWLGNQAGSGYIQMVNKINVGRRKGIVETPTLWYLYSKAPMDRNLWMAAYDFIRAKYRADFGLRAMHPRPTAMMRFNIMGFVNLRRYADTLIPLAKRLGFKRFDCGICYVHEPMNEEHGGVEALKYLCDKAHEAGMEVYFYCASAWANNKKFPVLTEHPDWVVRGRDGKPQPTGYPDLFALDLRSGWWDYSLAKYKELKEPTGMDGVWLDSWTMPNEYINFAEPEPRPTVVEAIKYVKAIQDLGYVTWIEGQSPVALDSFWYRQDRYGPLQGNEFVLFNTTPFAYAENGLFDLDLFRLLSYNCAMFQDPRLLCNAEDKITQTASHINHVMNEIHDTVGFPIRVRETSFGTTWECERGYAVFAHRSAKVKIHLPAGKYDVKTIDSEDKLAAVSDDGYATIEGTLMARGILIIQPKKESK
ncbi:MAG: glutamine amidotransferase [Planctomycetota bacterium]